MARNTSSALKEVDARSQLAASNKLELLCFNVGDSHSLYAINVFKVREVVKRSSYYIDHVADTGSPVIEGMIDHRIGLLPVINLARWLGEGMGANDDKVIICEYNKSNVGLLANKEAKIIRKDWSEIHIPPPSLLEIGKITNTTKITNDDGSESVVYILDVEQLLQEIAPRFSEMEESNVEHLTPHPVNNLKRILIAEDSHVARSQIKKQLGLLGIADYLMFNNGREILEYISGADPESIGLIITDLEMPEVSGFTVIKEIKANPTFQHIPIVVNSSMSEKNNEREAMQLGASGFIPKISPQQMAAAIQEFAIKR